MLLYESKLLKYYPQFSLKYIRHEMPMVEGWAFLSAALESDGWLQFTGIARKGDGYVAKEIASLMKQAEHLYLK